jgi:O-acetylserine/cysteine efflux transporter
MTDSDDAPVFEGAPPAVSDGADQPPPLQALPLSHCLLALLVVAIWGTNFVVIHQGLAQFSPFTFASLRFFLSSVPLLLFLPRPKTSLRLVVVYGLLVGAGQFGLMLYAMHGRISPGLASVLIQTQAFFTVGLAMLIGGERLPPRDLVGLLLCGAGVALAAAFTGGDNSLIGVLLVLGAALAWGGANVVARAAGPINALALVVWSNLFAIPPLALAAWLFEGPAQIAASLTHATPGGWATVFWQAFGNALFGYAAWNWLLGRHPASRVAPLGLMVPVFGLGASAWYLGESMPWWKLLAAAAIMGGLAVNILTGAAKSTRPRPAS